MNSAPEGFVLRSAWLRTGELERGSEFVLPTSCKLRQTDRQPGDWKRGQGLSSGKFALTYTVKNEARLLPSAIDYHIAAGCSRIYIFWDGTTDNSRDLVSKYPCVVARDSIRVDETADAPKWIKDILVCWDTDMDVRKRINTILRGQERGRGGF